MKVLLAVNFEEVEEYISGLPHVEIAGIVRDRKTVEKACTAYCPDVLMLSSYLDGNESMEKIISAIKRQGSTGLRVVYLYGEEDEYCSGFISFLEENGIYDYKIGRKLTSQDIEALLQNKRYEAPVRRQGNGKTVIVKEIDKAVIALYSNNATGKTHTAWNLSYCFTRRGYKVGLINLDRGYSANLYYGIGEQYQELLECITANGRFSEILDICYRRGNLSVVAGKCGSEEILEEKHFLQLLYTIKSKCDITLIDSRSGCDSNTQSALRHSTIDLMIFDSDIQHFHMNMKMLDDMGNSFIPEKTIAVINNSDIRSSSYRFIYNEIKKLKLPFKAVAPLSSCSSISQDLMHSDKVPYQFDNATTKDFRKDMDNIMEIINSREKRRSILQKLLG